MSDPFIGQIMMFGGNFAPRGWAFCDGDILPISQNQSLYSLLGTTYGGDGRTSFALPDLRGRTPIHVGNSNGQVHLLGQKGGEETHTLDAAEMPQHTHALQAAGSPATTNVPTGGLLAQTPATDPYYNALSSPANMSNTTPLAVGGGQAHNNMQPTLVLNFCIALQGLFPSRN